MQAALALLMLSQDTRHLQQNADPENTEDEECVITHVRSVVHRYHPYRRIEPRQIGVTPARSRVSLDAEPSGPVQQPAPARHPLPDRRPSLPGRRPSPTQSPSHEDDTPRVSLYSLKSIVFQALLATPTGEWVSARDIADFIKDKYSQLFEARGDQICRMEASRIMKQNIQFLEHSGGKRGGGAIKNPQRWRLADWARDTAFIVAWRTRQAREPPASSQPSGQAFSSIPYTHKSMTLQALLAAPEGRWLHSSELGDYISAQYPQLLQENGRRRVRARTTVVLSQTIGPLCEKYVSEDTKRCSPVFWRLAPDAREEATRLAWMERALENAEAE